MPRVRQSVRRRIRPQVQARFDSSDILQETQRVARQRLNDFLTRRPMPFRLWLLKTAHERLLDFERLHLKTAKRSVEREIPIPDASSVALASFVLEKQPGPASEAIGQEQAQVIRTCLAKLEAKDREVLLLRVFDDLSNAKTPRCSPKLLSSTAVLLRKDNGQRVPSHDWTSRFGALLTPQVELPCRVPDPEQYERETPAAERWWGTAESPS